MKTGVTRVNVTIPAWVIRAPKMRNASPSKSPTVPIFSVPRCQFVCFSIKKMLETEFFRYLGRPKTVYANPCEQGTPLTDDLSGAPVACALRSEEGTVCPKSHECTAVPGSTQAVCCPISLDELDELEGEASEDYNQAEERPQTSE